MKKPGRDPVGTQSGPSRDPIGHQFLHFWAPLLASREPVGIQSGSSRAPIFEFLAPRLDLSGSSQNHRKTCKNTAKMLCFMYLAASRHWCPTGSRLDPDWIPTGSRLDPDWIPTGSRLAKSGAQKCKNWCPTGSRRDPDWIHRLARTHSRTYFSFPRPTLAPIFLFRAPAVHQYPPPSCTKTVKAVLSQTGVLQDIMLSVNPLPHSDEMYTAVGSGL